MTGVRGPPGPSGASGPKGADGLDGERGSRGEPGATVSSWAAASFRGERWWYVCVWGEGGVGRR